MIRKVMSEFNKIKKIKHKKKNQLIGFSDPLPFVLFIYFIPAGNS